MVTGSVINNEADLKSEERKSKKKGHGRNKSSGDQAFLKSVFSSNNKEEVTTRNTTNLLTQTQVTMCSDTVSFTDNEIKFCT
jgi:hypothetical protein